LFICKVFAGSIFGIIIVNGVDEHEIITKKGIIGKAAIVRGRDIFLKFIQSP
jgi:hypothetical protein